MIRLQRLLLRAWLDWHIGWHDGRAERAETEAARHRQTEVVWRRRYEAAFPSPWKRGRA